MVCHGRFRNHLATSASASDPQIQADCLSKESSPSLNVRFLPLSLRFHSIAQPTASSRHTENLPPTNIALSGNGNYDPPTNPTDPITVGSLSVTDGSTTDSFIFDILTFQGSILAHIISSLNLLSSPISHHQFTGVTDFTPRIIYAGGPTTQLTLTLDATALPSATDTLNVKLILATATNTCDSPSALSLGTTAPVNGNSLQQRIQSFTPPATAGSYFVCVQRTDSNTPYSRVSVADLLRVVRVNSDNAFAPLAFFTTSSSAQYLTITGAALAADDTAFLAIAAPGVSTVSDTSFCTGLSAATGVTVGTSTASTDPASLLWSSKAAGYTTLKFPVTLTSAASSSNKYVVCYTPNALIKDKDGVTLSTTITGATVSIKGPVVQIVTTSR